MAKTAIKWDSKKNLRDNLTSFCAIYAQEMQQRYTDSQRKEIFNKLQVLLKQVPAVSDAVLHRFCMQQIKQIDKSEPITQPLMFPHRYLPCPGWFVRRAVLF